MRVLHQRHTRPASISYRHPRLSSQRALACLREEQTETNLSVAFARTRERSRTLKLAKYSYLYKLSDIRTVSETRPRIRVLYEYFVTRADLIHNDSH